MTGHLDGLDRLPPAQDDGGITPLALIELSWPIRRVILAILRGRRVTRSEIEETVFRFSPEDQLDPDELNTALITLVEKGWLSLLEDTPPRYRVNLRWRQAAGEDMAGFLSALSGR
jgi:hypothetical protein